MSVAEAARRRGVTATTVSNWRDRFIEAGKGGLENKTSGPAPGGTVAERRLRSENEKLKLALTDQVEVLPSPRNPAQAPEPSHPRIAHNRRSRKS
jgi:transposase-like protein